MTLRKCLEYLAARGTQVSRASLYRWNTELVDAGADPLIHQPSGRRGRVFVIPAEVEAYIRNRCSDNTPATSAS